MGQDHVDAEAEPPGGGWKVSIVVHDANLAMLSFDSPLLEELKMRLRDRAAIASIDREGLLVTMSSNESPTEAAEDSCMALRSALSEIGVEAPDLEVVRLARSRDFDDSVATAEMPPNYLSLAEVAKQLGVSRQRATVMHQTGKLPRHVVSIGRSIGFLPADIDRLAETRSER